MTIAKDKAMILTTFFTEFCSTHVRHADEMLRIYHDLEKGKNMFLVKFDVMERTAVDRIFYKDIDPMDLAYESVMDGPFKGGGHKDAWFPKFRNQEQDLRRITHHHKAFRLGRIITQTGREFTEEVRRHLPDWEFIRDSARDGSDSPELFEKHVSKTIFEIFNKLTSKYQSLIRQGVKPWIPVPAGVPRQMFRPYPNYRIGHSVIYKKK